MAIATEVAKVSGALRCNRWGRELDGAPSFVITSTESSLVDFLDDTAVYAQLEREKILKALKAKPRKT